MDHDVTLALKCCRKESTLTPEKVLEIYNLRSAGLKRRLGASIARKYGVSSRAIRDIWNGVSWSRLTSTMHAGLPLIRIGGAYSTVMKTAISSSPLHPNTDFTTVSRIL